MPDVWLTLRETGWRLWAWLRRDQLQRELEREMALHRELLARDYEHAGLESSDAMTAANRRFGGVLRHREASADVWGFPRLESIVHDLRYGARLLRRSPGFAAVAIGATALAIGVNCSFFTLVDSLVWRPIPVAGASSMVRLVTVVANKQTSLRFSYPEYVDISAHAKSLRAVVAFAPGQLALADPAGDRRARSVGANFVSGNYFDVLGGSASLGRVLNESDNLASASPVVVINPALWAGHFASAPDIIGRDVIVEGAHATIAGVARRDFVGINPVVPDLWMPVTLAARIGAVGARLTSRTDRFLVLHGPLQPGVTLARAASEISRLVAEPAPHAGSIAADARVTGAAVLPQSSLVPLDRQTALIALPGFVAVGLVLVIACANLGSLLLARALARQREVAMRLALGATRVRLLRQLLTESMLIALLGAGLGLVLANWVVTAIWHAVVSSLPISIGTVVLNLEPSGRVYAFTLALSLGCVLIFGLVPAMHGTTLELTASLKGEDRAFGTRLRRSRFRDWLIAGQVAACVVLGVAAGTLVRTLHQSVRTDTGLRPAQVLVASLGIAEIGRVTPQAAAERESFAARSARLRGVVGSARTSAIPFSGAWDHLHVTVGGDPSYTLPYSIVTPGYFDVVGQRILRGRDFAADDSSSGARVAIVTLAAARVLFPGGDGLGGVLQVVRANGAAPDSLIPYEIVGIATDARSSSLWYNDGNGYVYLSASRRDLAMGRMPSLLRTDGSTGEVIAALDQLAREINPQVPLETMRLTTLLNAQVVPFRFAAVISTAIGVLGLALAAVGLYGVVAFSVRQRQRDVAVHVALGAGPRDVVALVLRRELQLVVVGLAIGIVLGFGEAGLMRASGVPVAPLGVWGSLLVALALLSVATAATLLPAAKALRTDPMQVLRQE